MDDLTNLLEDEATRKADGERRSRRNLPGSGGGKGTGTRTGTGTSAHKIGGGGGPIPSSELRRYGKKLEEAVRSREQAADVAQRLALPCRGAPGPSGRLMVDGVKQNGRRKGRGAVVVPPVARNIGAGGAGCNDVALASSSRGLPASARLDSLARRGSSGARNPSTTSTAVIKSGQHAVDDDGGVILGVQGKDRDVDASATTAADSASARQGRHGRQQRGGGALATKLRGAVRVSREEQALDDEKFWK